MGAWSFPEAQSGLVGLFDGFEAVFYFRQKDCPFLHFTLLTHDIQISSASGVILSGATTV
jgi:hypothetical protein